MRILDETIYDGSGRCIYAVGTSSESKPTDHVISGSIYFEVDTSKAFMYNETSHTWVEAKGTVDEAAIEAAVAEWLEAHPEATTTVADGSITEPKLASALLTKINNSASGVTRLSDEIDTLDSDVTDLKSAIDDVTDESYEDTSDISISWTNGGYYRISDGTFVENDAYYYSEISIANGEKYVHFIGTPLYYACGIIFMNGTAKVGDSVPSASSTTPINGNFEIPSGATKIRISKYNQPCSLAYSQKIYVINTPQISANMLDSDLKTNLKPGQYEEQVITWGSANQYINPNNGVISDAGATNAHVSDYIDVSEIPYIRLTASPYYSFCCLAFYDGNKSFIQAYPSGSSNVNYWMEEIGVPDNAKYAVFGNNSAISGKLNVKVEFMTSYATFLTRKWIGKKWACVGDSLTEINDRASMRYMDYIQIATGIKPYNIGVSGTGYANGHANNKAFIDRIVNVPTDSDIVTIFGSNNDMFGDNLPVGDPTDTGTTTLCGFINGTIDALYNAFPTAILGIITPCPWENIYPSAITTLGQKGIAYSQALVDICKRRGIPCLDLFHCSGMRPWEASYRVLYYTGDEGGGVHPDANGHKILATHIKAFLETLLL